MSDDDGIQAWAPIEVVEGLLKRAEQAEAAIQRVRDTCESKQGRQSHNDPWNRGWDAALAWVERALEGGSDE